MIRSKFIYLLGLFLLASCNSNSENQGESYDDLPEAEWNGEYMEVKTKDGKDKKGRSKKSIGGEFLNMGKATYSIGDKAEEITLFDKGKTDITINEDQIAIRIKDANDKSFFIGIHKANIYKNPEGKYTFAANAKNSKDAKFTLSYTTGSKSEQETYQLKSGTLTIEQMSFTLGEVKMKAKGELLNLKNIQTGTPEPFEMEVEILFETIVSAFNPEL